MARKLTDETILDAQRLNAEGMTMKEVAAALGHTDDGLRNRMRAMGIKPVVHKRKAKRLDLPVDKIASMYQDGYSENAIAKHFGVARTAVRPRLIDAGITPRSQGESELLKWSKMTEEQRANQVKSAHAACIGVTKSFEHRVAIAKAREKAVADHHIGVGEPEFKEFLSSRGIPFIYQKAVDTYNLDFAIGSVAVELTSVTGRYRGDKEHLNKRTVNLLERGYKTLGVEFDCAESLMACAEYVVATVQEMNGLESFGREYWVIRCRRQDTTVIKNDVGQFAAVKTPVEYVKSRRSINLD